MKNNEPKSDISSVLGALQKSEDQSSDDPTMKEIFKIDSRAFEMARLVLQNSKERANLKEEAVELMDRLDSLSDTLEAENPESFDKMADQSDFG